jgi:hypothetical protein
MKGELSEQQMRPLWRRTEFAQFWMTLSWQLAFQLEFRLSILGIHEKCLTCEIHVQVFWRSSAQKWRRIPPHRHYGCNDRLLCLTGSLQTSTRMGCCNFEEFDSFVYSISLKVPNVPLQGRLLQGVLWAQYSTLFFVFVSRNITCDGVL